MIKTFEEFCNERLFNSTVKREQQGVTRLEDKLPEFFHEEDVFQIKGYDKWYVHIDVEYSDTFDQNAVYAAVYCAPNDEDCIEFSAPFYEQAPEYTVDDWVEPEYEVDKYYFDTVEDSEFVEALNETLKELPKEFWIKLGSDI